VPPEKPECATNVDMRWFYNGTPKDLPEPFPLPGAYSGKFLDGLQTQSGKFEFIPSSLKRLEPEQNDRPALLQYMPAFDGARQGARYGKYPIQMITPHQRFSFHTAQDGKGGTLSDVPDHRMLVDGHYYWIIRMNEADAAARGITHRSLVKVFNDRAEVICAAEVTSRMAAGVAHSYESSAEYVPLGEAGKSPDIGGCVNLLTPARMQAKGTVASAGSLCLVQIEPWETSGKNALEAAE
jgi:anaerobic selenocysteine-containing dehydrogenase